MFDSFNNVMMAAMLLSAGPLYAFAQDINIPRYVPEFYAPRCALEQALNN
jgi:hypothetical protein